MPEYIEFTRKEPVLKITNLTKRLGGKIIIRDIGTEKMPFCISDVVRPGMLQGQTVAVLGPSGSGKSTLFKLITGIVEVHTGLIEVPDKNNPAEYVRVKAGDAGYVQQGFPTSRNQSVEGMFIDAARQARLPSSSWKKLIDDYIEEWDLRDQRKLSSNKLSGGQRQRVAIIEQLILNPSLLVLDEPFSGLDIRNTDDVKKNMRRLTTASETNTIIFSTHDVHLAVEMADKIFVMGYERDQDKKLIPGGTIVESYDLKDAGLAWSTEFTTDHENLAKEIMDVIRFYR